MAGRSLNETELEAYDLVPREVAERARIYRVRLLPGGYSGMALGRRVFLAREVETDGTSQLMAHELVHVRQWHERGVIGFPSRYLASFIKNLIRLRKWNAAYEAIDVEQQASREAGEWKRLGRIRKPQPSANPDPDPDPD